MAKYDSLLRRSERLQLRLKQIKLDSAPVPRPEMVLDLNNGSELVVLEEGQSMNEEFANPRFSDLPRRVCFKVIRPEDTEVGRRLIEEQKRTMANAIVSPDAKVSDNGSEASELLSPSNDGFAQAARALRQKLVGSAEVDELSKVANKRVDRRGTVKKSQRGRRNGSGII